jgi:hypothetical protein
MCSSSRSSQLYAEVYGEGRGVCVCVCVYLYGTFSDNLDGDISELSNAFNIFGNSF